MSELLSMFQELGHFQNELFNKTNENDIFELLSILEHVRQKWHTAAVELEGSHRIARSQEDEISELRVQTRETQAKLLECRSQVSGLLTQVHQLEMEKKIMENRFDSVRDLMRDEIKLLPEQRKRLEFLDEKGVTYRDGSCSAMLDSADYDRTDDSLDDENGGDQRRLKRSISLTRVAPSAPNVDEADEPTPRKRSRDDMQLAAGNNHNSRRSPSMNRSFSERNVGVFQAPVPRSLKSVTDLAKLSPATCAATGRRHVFMSKTSLKSEYCDVCNKRMGFAETMWRCEACKAQTHGECRKNVALPCVPRGTPAKNQRGKLVDYVPKDPPMIPSVVVHCVNELDRRGLSSVGLYRVPGSETQICDLLHKMVYGRAVPNLHHVSDVNVMTGIIKKFLLQLAEPLIPATSTNEFIKAGELYQNGGDSMTQLHKSIVELPIPNRDTLAFLMIHFNKVAEFASENKMTKENLAAILGPTLMGSPTLVDYGVVAPEVAKLTSVVNALFQFPPEYWGRLLAQSESVPIMGNGNAVFASAAVFDDTTGAGTSLLGPMPTHGTGTITPRHYGFKPRTGNKGKFFNNPLGRFN